MTIQKIIKGNLQLIFLLTRSIKNCLPFIKGSAEKQKGIKEIYNSFTACMNISIIQAQVCLQGNFQHDGHLYSFNLLFISELSAYKTFYMIYFSCT